MSNGDEEEPEPEDAESGEGADAGEADAEEIEAEEESGEIEAEEESGDADAEEETATLEERLDGVEDALSADEVDADALSAAMDEAEAAIDLAGTEAALDEVDAALDEIADALEATDLPEPEDEDEEDPREALESRLSDLRDAAGAERGPYAEDVVATIEEAESTIEDTRWTEQGEGEVVEAVAAFVGATNDALDADVAAPDGIADAVGALSATADAVEAADLDPDEDAATIAALVEAGEALSSGVDDAQAWSDLSTREQLDAEGFYDPLDHRKDYPPEWHALKAWEQRGNAEMILLALGKLEADFMEEHCLDALRRMGPEEAIEPMLERAGRRDVPGIEILGKIGAEEAVDTLVEYADADGDPNLQKTALKALGEIGSGDATQAVANALADENDSVRTYAARSLGMIGDTRAVDPLLDVLEGDDADEVRAGAAWALNQIGTERALEAASDYADDRSYLVQSEAEKAAAALGAAPA